MFKLQLSLLQHSTDAAALKIPRFAEYVWEPKTGHTKSGAQPLMICGTLIPDDVTAESKWGLLTLM